MSKKLLARLLSLTLCAGMVLQPVTAYAGQEVGEVDEAEEVVVDAPDEEVPDEEVSEAEALEVVPEASVLDSEASLLMAAEPEDDDPIIPEPEIRTISVDNVLSSLRDSYKVSDPLPTVSFESDERAMEYSFVTWQVDARIKWVDVSGGNFSPGTSYRVRMAATIAEGSKDTCKIDPNFKLVVNKKEWKQDGFQNDAEGNVETIFFVSPAITAEETTKTTISSVTVNTDPELTFVIADYGYCIEPTFISETEGIKATFVKWLKKTEDDSWEDYNEERFDVGYYKAQFAIVLDPKYEDKYELDWDCSCNYESRECEYESRESILGVRKIVFNSPVFYSKYVYGNSISRIRSKDGIIYFDPYRGASKYEVEINKKLYYTEEPSFDAAKACYEQELPFGLYTVYITAVDEEMKPISNGCPHTFTYNILSEEGKKQISTIEATSNIADIFVDGEKYQEPTFSGPAPVTFMNIHWQKYLHENFIPVTSDDKDYFSEGQYRYRVLLHIEGRYFNTHEFAEDPKLIVDGVEWTCESKALFDDGKIMNIFFLSPVYTIGEDPEPEPEEIKGTWKTKWGATYFITEDGETLTGMQKIGGDFYLFSKRGTLQTGKFYTENEKTYYFGKDGKRITGWMTKWSSTYYFDEEGVMQTGFTDIEGYTYYFKADGRFVHTAWITIGDKKYYAKSDGKLAKGETITKWGKKYSFDADGVLIQ
ncbi:hypothetical protein NXH67_03920 [Butyrivibrio sp. DSM 10294]|uniref:N-acetylmuramoyl-L-alanine amidase family protein n=1 Tax=Butyrivibrio sp. DSM 10294 TaxID=2972457 RepID=UPI00234FA912|nr:hypothetical protein [Butyrivibrio sp. DSM 10294]MDC7292660.1 hypothetical protein [Butyrivibrio sp. DSM 10294]